jgi:hypothetical protein
MANRRFIDFPIASTVGDNDIVLIWQDGLNKQTTKGTLIQGAPTSLEGLTDVDIAGLINGQILQYNSVTGKWENVDRTGLNLSELGDVSIVSPSNGQVLVYNSTTSKWENSSAGFVPYVGAVTTVDLGAQGLRAGYVRFNTSVVSVPNEQGLMYWDGDDETIAVILNGYIMKIGEDQFYPVKNQTGSSIAKGTAVRFAGTVGASGRLLIAPFIADGSVSSSFFMGVTAEAIADGADGKVLYFGRIRGINTNAFNEGDVLYASTTVAGGFQTAVPVAPNNIVQVAAVINKSINQGVIFIRPSFGSNINQDEGVKIVSPTTGQLLQLQANGLWENKTTAQVLGGTSSQFVKGDGTLDSNTYQVTSEKGQPNGYASLDSNGKVPLVQINDALIGNVNFQGLWNAATNTPTLANPPASGTKGYYYIVDTAGTFASISFEVGDWIISDGTAWGKVDNTDAVSSVFGRTGNVTAANGDYTTAQVTESGNLYYTDGRARGALSFVAGSGAYNSSTGVITIPTNNNQITNGAGYITSAALSGYLPLTGGTLTGPLNGTSASFNNRITASQYRITPDGTNALYNIVDATNTYAGLYIMQAGEGSAGFGGAFIAYGHSHATKAGWTTAGISQGSAGRFSVNTQGTGGGIDVFTVDTSGNGVFNGSVTATSFIRSGGTSSQFLKADGSVDSSTYVSNVTASSPLFSSGGATPNITIQQASGSQNGFLSSTDWTTFNNKQNALTNPVTGTGVNGRVAFWNATNTITSDSDLLFNGNTLTLLTGNVEIAAGNGLILFNPNTTNYFQLYTNNGNELNFGFGGTTPVVAKISSSGTMTLTGDIFIEKAAPSVQLRAGNSSNAAFILANSSNTHNWTFESDFGAAGQQGELRIRNSILGSNAITISTLNAATFSSSVFAGGSILTSPSGADTIIGAYGGQDCSLILEDANQLWELYVNDDFYINRGSTNVLSLNRNTGAATFSSSVTATKLTSGGNLEVGTSSGGDYILKPGVSAAGTGSLIIQAGFGSAGAGGAITLYSHSHPTYPGGVFIGRSAGASGAIILGGGGTSPSSPQITITSVGNVLIGTTTDSGAKLEVNGDIRTGALDGGYVAGYWKLGRALSGSQPSETHQIIVEINGALFSIGAAAL